MLQVDEPIPERIEQLKMYLTNQTLRRVAAKEMEWLVDIPSTIHDAAYWHMCNRVLIETDEGNFQILEISKNNKEIYNWTSQSGQASSEHQLRYVRVFE